MDQRCSNTAVNAAGQTQNHIVATNLGTNGSHGLADIVWHIPVRLAATDIMNKACDDGGTLDRVGDFRMELNRIEMSGLVGHTCNRAVVR